jgi:hypothetical protein
MSPIKRKYKLIDAFFSRIRPFAPDSPSRAKAEKPAAEAAASLSPAGGWQGFFPGIAGRRTMGFTFDRGTVTSLEQTPMPLPEDALRIPLTVSGKTIGVVQAAGKEAGWTAQEIEIVSAVAAQLARHLENLRPSE